MLNTGLERKDFDAKMEVLSRITANAPQVSRGTIANKAQYILDQTYTEDQFQALLAHLESGSASHPTGWIKGIQQLEERGLLSFKDSPLQKEKPHQNNVEGSDTPEITRIRDSMDKYRELEVGAESDRGMIGCFAFTALATGGLAAGGLLLWAWPTWIPWTAVGVSVLSGAAVFVGISNRSEKKKEAEILARETQLIGALSRSDNGGDDRRPDYFQQLVTINVSNLREYYFLVKSHTDKSFRLCSMMSALGFLAITFSVFGLDDQDQSLRELSAISGILIEFISAVFFYLYNRTVRQLKEYHDSLLSVQNVLLALRLIDEITDTSEKSQSIQALLGVLVGEKGPNSHPGGSAPP